MLCLVNAGFSWCLVHENMTIKLQHFGKEEGILTICSKEANMVQGKLMI